MGNRCITVHISTPSKVWEAFSSISFLSIFIYPLVPLLSCLPPHRYLFFSSDGRNGCHSNREKRKENRGKEGKKVPLHPSPPHSISFSLHLCFLFFLISSRRLVSWSLSWSFHLFFLSAPPALPQILHLSLCILEFRGWLYPKNELFPLCVCVCVSLCTVLLTGRVVSCFRSQLLVSCIIHLL